MGGKKAASVPRGAGAGQELSQAAAPASAAPRAAVQAGDKAHGERRGAGSRAPAWAAGGLVRLSARCRAVPSCPPGCATGSGHGPGLAPRPLLLHLQMSGGRELLGASARSHLCQHRPSGQSWALGSPPLTPQGPRCQDRMLSHEAEAASAARWGLVLRARIAPFIIVAAGEIAVQMHLLRRESVAIDVCWAQHPGAGGGSLLLQCGRLQLPGRSCLLCPQPLCCPLSSMGLECACPLIPLPC